MCNCIERVKKMMDDHFHEKNPSAGPTIDISINNESLILGAKTEMQLASIVEVRHQSGSKEKVNKMGVTYTFCPFCGEKY